MAQYFVSVFLASNKNRVFNSVYVNYLHGLNVFECVFNLQILFVTCFVRNIFHNHVHHKYQTPSNIFYLISSLSNRQTIVKIELLKFEFAHNCDRNKKMRNFQTAHSKTSSNLLEFRKLLLQ